MPYNTVFQLLNGYAYAKGHMHNNVRGCLVWGKKKESPNKCSISMEMDKSSDSAESNTI